MRRYPLVLLLCALLFILSLSSAAAYQQSTPPATPLQVVDFQPAPGQELGLTDPAILYFDRPLDCATASGAVMVTPAVPGDVTCDAAAGVLTFTPTAAYQRATEYALSVSTALHGQDGAALPEAFTVKMNTLGYLVVSDFLPADGSTGIETGSLITVIFNRPVVPLVSVEDMGTLPNPIAIRPEVTGRGEWLNTSIYVFHPDPALAGGTNYTVSVDSALQAIDGSILAAPVKWSFTTVEPAIVDTLPRDQASDFDINGRIQVTFNQPMNQASTETNFYLRPIGQVNDTLTGTFEWNDAFTGFSFQAAAPLALDEVYAVGFQNPPTGASGTASLTGFSRWTFATIPYPAIIGTDPFDGDQGISPYSSFSIYFASPMDPATIADKITIEPTPWRDADGYYNSYDNSYNLNFPIEPSTTYTVTIAPGMADPYGNTIDTPLTVKYTTGPYEPNVNLQVPGDVGLYNAYNDATQLFITHLNVDRLDFRLYGIPTDVFTNRVMADSYNPSYEYNPDPSYLLRQWQLDTTSPLNTQNYALLQLDDTRNANTGMTIPCPGAPASRLKVGDVAVVTSDPDPVRARASVPDGEIVKLLYRDYRMSIVGGPVCANNIVWWQVQLGQEGTAWIAEGLGNEYFVDVLIAGQSTPVALTGGPDTGALAPGIYLLQVSAPAITYPPYESHFLVVATANLTLKYTVNSVLIWATDLQTGQPIPNVTIAVNNQDHSFSQVGVTDSDGLARIDMPRVNDLYQPLIAVLKTDDQFAIGTINWSDGIDPWNFSQSSNYYPEQYAAYVYTDRPIYRPDQPVYFRGVVRQRDDVTYTPPPFSTIPVTIYDDQSQIVYQKDLTLSPFGTFSDTFQLDTDAGLGYYRIEAVLPSENPELYYAPRGTVGFSVAEFRLPEFQVDMQAEQDAVAQGDT
ncbi:MAG: Ig-like domain-containing protein, partial [Anaerolineae bacterium]|nr:Ig-like domain-containing protein [Anaerolineae bacterium]